MSCLLHFNSSPYFASDYSLSPNFSMLHAYVESLVKECQIRLTRIVTSHDSKRA
jgi:hypothetical protein